MQDNPYLKIDLKDYNLFTCKIYMIEKSIYKQRLQEGFDIENNTHFTLSAI